MWIWSNVHANGKFTRVYIKKFEESHKVLSLTYCDLWGWSMPQKHCFIYDPTYLKFVLNLASRQKHKKENYQVMWNEEICISHWECWFWSLGSETKLKFITEFTSWQSLYRFWFQRQPQDPEIKLSVNGI